MNEKKSPLDVIRRAEVDAKDPIAAQQRRRYEAEQRERKLAEAAGVNLAKIQDAMINKGVTPDQASGMTQVHSEGAITTSHSKSKPRTGNVRNIGFKLEDPE